MLADLPQLILSMPTEVVRRLITFYALRKQLDNSWRKLRQIAFLRILVASFGPSSAFFSFSNSAFFEEASAEAVTFSDLTETITCSDSRDLFWYRNWGGGASRTNQRVGRRVSRRGANRWAGVVLCLCQTANYYQSTLIKV